MINNILLFQFFYKNSIFSTHTINDINVQHINNAKHAVENPADCNNGKLSFTIGILSANEYKLEKHDMKHGHNDNTNAIYIL